MGKLEEWRSYRPHYLQITIRFIMLFVMHRKAFLLLRPFMIKKILLKHTHIKLKRNKRKIKDSEINKNNKYTPNVAPLHIQEGYKNINFLDNKFNNDMLWFRNVTRQSDLFIANFTRGFHMSYCVQWSEGEKIHFNSGQKALIKKYNSILLVSC